MLDNMIPNLGASDDDILAALEQNVADAQADLEETQKRANTAFLNALSDKSADKKAADKIRDELAAAQRTLDERTGALLAGRAVAQERQVQSKAENDKTAWADAEKIMKKRLKLAVELQAEVENFRLKFDELLFCKSELISTATGHGIRIHGSELSAVKLESTLRLALLSQGFAWAAEWTGDRSQIPTISQVVKDGNAAVFAKNPANKDAA